MCQEIVPAPCPPRKCWLWKYWPRAWQTWGGNMSHKIAVAIIRTLSAFSALGFPRALLSLWSMLIHYTSTRVYGGRKLHGLLMPIDVTPTRTSASSLPRGIIGRDLVGLSHRPQRRDQLSFYRMACSGQGYLPQRLRATVVVFNKELLLWLPCCLSVERWSSQHYRW